MAPQNIPEEEWQEVVDICYDIEDALEQDDDRLYAEYLFDLNCQLDKLQQKHGELALLTATRADYCEDPEQQVALYQQAVTLAELQGDTVARIQSLEAICELFIDEFDDADAARVWLDKLEKAIAEDGSEWLAGDLEQLKANITG